MKPYGIGDLAIARLLSYSSDAQGTRGRCDKAILDTVAREAEPGST